VVVMLASEHFVTRASVRIGVVADDVETEASAEVRTALGVEKARVPACKARVGSPVWRAITSPHALIHQTPHINRAYHKLHEISLSCALPRTVARSVHLCEAPGGFVACTADHLATDGWQWRAVTLADGIAPSNDPRMPNARGAFLLTDVTARDPHEVAADLVSALGGAPVDLVTADGASEMDHVALEEQHFELFAAQCRVAMRCLATGGVFVIKFFEGLLARTRRVIAWLSTHFRQVSIIKPTSSRATNSERYLVCRERTSGPDDDDPTAYDRVMVSAQWDAELDHCLARLAWQQVRSLRDTMTALGERKTG
jgi:23S rRNA U2552 (ribose-2'-O)-methylase RlmE/FtsJ